jgi:arylsulfatase A-like enzyme
MSRPGRRVLGGVALALAAGLLVLGVFLMRGDAARPRGTVEDVLALGKRSDLSVLFILVDTLRADRLGVYGYERDTSPNLDALAAEGIRFANHVSQSSWTKCSMASLWTGLYPVRTRVLRSYDVLADAARTPAETFREAGFRTAGIFRNGWVAPNFGFGQGFEIYLKPRSQRGQRARMQRIEHPNLTLDGDDGDVLDSTREFLRVHGHERFFLYLHMMDVHQYAYSAEHALFGSSYSDHGEAFGEHDGEGHARNVYGEVTQTPVILSLPFRLDPGIVVSARSENVDLWPTVLELVGLPGLPDTDGHSLVPEIVTAARGGEAPPDDGVAFAQIDQRWARVRETPRPMVAVNKGKWRLIYRSGQPKQSELYDKGADPREQQDLAAQQPELTESLNELAVGYLESRPPPWGDDAPVIEIDEMEMNQLRALGYGVQ